MLQSSSQLICQLHSQSIRQQYSQAIRRSTSNLRSLSASCSDCHLKIDQSATRPVFQSVIQSASQSDSQYVDHRAKHCHSIDWEAIFSFRQTVCQSVAQSAHQSISQPVSQTPSTSIIEQNNVTLVIGQPLLPSFGIHSGLKVNQLSSQIACQSAAHSVHQSISQSTTQSVIQVASQSFKMNSLSWCSSAGQSVR